MTQRIIIIALARGPGDHLLGDAVQMLAEKTFRTRAEALVEENRVLFFSEHLDARSVGDSFERLLRPKSQVSFVEHSDEQLYAIPIPKLTMRLPPRDREERLLHNLLRTARSFADGVDSEGWIFVWRKGINGVARTE